MAAIEERGNSTRVTWLYGGGRGGAKQSCTFQGPPEGRAKLVEAAKELVELRNHKITRPEVYRALLGEGTPDGEDVKPVPTFKSWALEWV